MTNGSVHFSYSNAAVYFDGQHITQIYCNETHNTYYYIITNLIIILSLLNIQSWYTKISVNIGIESMSKKINL